MHYFLTAALFLFVVTLSSGCNSDKVSISPPVAKKPSWFFTPSQEGGTAGIGHCGVHINGISAQRALAISRAIDEIATIKGVKVENVTVTTDKVTNSSVVSTLDSYSIHTSDQKVINATIREIWIDPSDQALYVWMIAK